jgi:NaMN:DMB phosphoribosyltransferase
MIGGLTMIDFSKFKVPTGSLLVDGGLVVVLVIWGTQMTAKLDQISARLEKVEQTTIQPEADRRIAVIEARFADTTQRLQSIEAKLDRALERR